MIFYDSDIDFRKKVPLCIEKHQVILCVLFNIKVYSIDKFCVFAMFMTMTRNKKYVC